jgi:uncharacterized protein YggU (UPF0235/DUF167 family)
MYLHVRVLADAKEERVEAVGENRLKISVKEPAKQNRANRRVVALVAGHLGVAVGKVRLVNGHTSPTKLFSIAD